MPKGLFKSTSIERKVRRELKKMNLHWKSNCSIKSGGIKGHFNVDFLVDIYDSSGKKISECVIECNGGYYHCDARLYPIKENFDAIQKKNYERDKKKMMILDTLYNYIILWEKEIKERSFGKKFRALFEKAREEILNDRKFKYFENRNV